MEPSRLDHLAAALGMAAALLVHAAIVTAPADDVLSALSVGRSTRRAGDGADGAKLDGASGGDDTWTAVRVIDVSIPRPAGFGPITPRSAGLSPGPIIPLSAGAAVLRTSDRGSDGGVDERAGTWTSAPISSQRSLVSVANISSSNSSSSGGGIGAGRGAAITISLLCEGLGLKPAFVARARELKSGGVDGLPSTASFPLLAASVVYGWSTPATLTHAGMTGALARSQSQSPEQQLSDCSVTRPGIVAIPWISIIVGGVRVNDDAASPAANVAPGEVGSTPLDYPLSRNHVITALTKRHELGAWAWPPLSPAQEVHRDALASLLATLSRC